MPSSVDGLDLSARPWSYPPRARIEFHTVGSLVRLLGRPHRSQIINNCGQLGAVATSPHRAVDPARMDTTEPSACSPKV